MPRLESIRALYDDIRHEAAHSADSEKLKQHAPRPSGTNYYHQTREKTHEYVHSEGDILVSYT